MIGGKILPILQDIKLHKAWVYREPGYTEKLYDDIASYVCPGTS